MNEEISEDEIELNETQREIVEALSSEQISIIDSKLMEYASSNWRKVARLVGSSMLDLQNTIHAVPDIFYGQRVASLVAQGKLISQGNLNRMQFSEVKLP